MSELVPSDSRATNRQIRLIALILLPVLAILAAVYFTLLKPELVVLARDVRAEEAAAIVAELKKQEVAYELSQQGSTIMVPSDRADELRLSLVAGDIASAGSVGFELFNQSDMGLTDFAQKVNYQRALQGELTRTIMAMDGIASARVHLALPERTLFRANRSEPRAAVTIVPKPNIMIDPARIAGIQQLVASTVPELKPEMVTVLNQRGQLVSRAPEEPFSAANMKDATVLERAYAERVGRTIGMFDPALSFDLKVATSPRVADPNAVIPDTLEARDHAIRVVVFTPRALSPERQAELSSIIASAIGARQAAGDDIRFSMTPQTAPVAPEFAEPALSLAEPLTEQAKFELDSGWLWLSGLVGAAGLALMLTMHARRRRFVRRERLIAGLTEQLRLEQVSR